MKRFNSGKRVIGSKKQLGQGMTEYIIIVALVAIGAIGVYSAFGRTVQLQMAAVTQGLAGNGAGATTDITSAGTEATQADTDANRVQGLNNYAQNVNNQ